MTSPRSSARFAGWLFAGTAALGLLGGAAAFALAAQHRTKAIVLDLAPLPSSTPAITAVVETAPDAVLSEPAPTAPAQVTDPAPVLPDNVVPPPLRKLVTPRLSDLSLKQPDQDAAETIDSTPRPKPKPTKSAPKSAPEPERPKKPEEPRAEEGASSPVTTASSAGSRAKATGGELSPRAYAKAILKKVRATGRKLGAGKGTAIVGFSISPNGGLSAVQVLKSSGNAALDEIAMDHIRRSAPFPAPPPDAGRDFSFEFVGK